MFEDIYESLFNKLKNDGKVALLTYLKPTTSNTGSIENKILITKANIHKELPLIDQEFEETILNTFNTGIPSIYSEHDETILIEPFFPKPRLIILGGGHIAKPLSEFGKKVGFSVVVIDDRPTFANSKRFADADEVICEDFNKAFELLSIRATDFVVIVTRGHRHDGVCLRNTLKFTPAYIGMIGSKRRVKAMMDELITEGYDSERLNSVCSPIGLDIGAVTPEEIAIAIIGEVISYRRNAGSKLSKDKRFSWPEFDTDVIKEVINKSEIPRALITIISSKGSVPRKAGAKMLVWLDGRILGTIGGGCSEANILTLARDIIHNQGYSIEHVDMTGIVAEDEGMVCGGTMEVLIEAID